MQTLHVRNKEALRNPVFVNFLKEAILAIPGAAPGGIDSCADNIYAFVTDPDFVLIVGIEEGNFVCCMLACLNRANMLFPYPSVIFFYNKGSRAIRDAVKGRMLDTVAEMGYTVFHTANMSGHTDKVWERAVGYDRLTLKPIGTLYEIRIK